MDSIKIIGKLGEKVNNEISIYYLAWQNTIPVFCSALTDGDVFLGDMMIFYSFRKPRL